MVEIYVTRAKIKIIFRDLGMTLDMTLTTKINDLEPIEQCCVVKMIELGKTRKTSQKSSELVHYWRNPGSFKFGVKVVL
jgi:hypothetical protein